PTSAEIRTRGASRSTRRSGEVRQHLLAEQADRPQHALLFHAAPLQADHHRRDAQALAVPRDLLAHAHGVADHEAVARQLLEGIAPRLALGQRLVLLPALIGLVLRLEDGSGLREGAGPAVG